MGTLNKATKAGWFPIIMGQRYTINIIVVIVLTFAMYAYLKFSKQGYEISVVGESENTARYAGINVRRVTVRTMLISGAVCGLCGFLIVAGTGPDHLPPPRPAAAALRPSSWPGWPSSTPSIWR